MNSETIVEVKLENLTLKQLVDFLWKVESSNILAGIKSLYIKKNLTNTEMFDSVIEIHYPKLIPTESHGRNFVNSNRPISHHRQSLQAFYSW